MNASTAQAMNCGAVATSLTGGCHQPRCPCSPSTSLTCQSSTRLLRMPMYTRRVKTLITQKTFPLGDLSEAAGSAFHWTPQGCGVPNPIHRTS